MVINQKKLERQDGIVTKWIREFGGKGTLEACTGFGKTFTAILAIKRFKVKNPEHVVKVVVPSIPLKAQWEKELNKNKITNCFVYVINTYIKHHHNCTLLILDEVHGFLSDEFYKVFENTEYKFVLGLTATLERLDGKHNLVDDKCPIFDTVTLEEARREGYVSNFTVYNLGLDFNEQDRIKYNDYHSTFNNTFAYFERDFDLAMNCAKGDKTIIKIPRYGQPPLVYTGKQFREQFSTRMGWNGELYDESGVEESNFYHPKTVTRKAMQWLSSMRLRKKMVHVATSKIDAIEEIVNMYPEKKIMVFSENSEFADAVTERLGDICISYHTKVQPLKREVVKSKKTKYGIIEERTLKKLSIKRSREVILEEFKENKFRVISSIRSLDEGFDDEKVDLIIMASYNSSKRQDTQRTGRGVRAKDGKNAIIINLYMMESQEEKWLKGKQKDKNGIIWIRNVSELNVGEMELF